MKTWSLADVMDVFKRVEKITRPPRRNDGAEQLAEREAAEEVSEPVSRADHLGPYHGDEMFESSWLGSLTADDGRLTDDDTPNPAEPGLTDSELVAVRQILEERYGSAL